MERPFECPDCRCRHDEPAVANFVLHVRCLDCELEVAYRADRTLGFEDIPRAA